MAMAEFGLRSELGLVREWIEHLAKRCVQPHSPA
jgi:hypothetical protein